MLVMTGTYHDTCTMVGPPLLTHATFIDMYCHLHSAYYKHMPYTLPPQKRMQSAQNATDACIGEYKGEKFTQAEQINSMKPLC